MATGALTEVGSCIAKRYDEYGANLILLDNDMEKLNMLANKFKEGTYIIESTIFTDHTRLASSLTSLQQRIQKKIDILIIAHSESHIENLEKM